MGAKLVNGWLQIPRSMFTDSLERKFSYFDENSQEVVNLFSMVDGDVLLPRTAMNDLGLTHLLGNRVWTPKKFAPIKLGVLPGQDEQPKAVDAALLALKDNFGAVLQADCGMGKTVMALEIARRIGLPTLILVHKEHLMTQWKKEIQKFFPTARVGIWRMESGCSGDHHDFVIGMIQSVLSSRDYGSRIYDSFGLLLSDEIHRTASTEWRKVIVKFSAPYRLGLTATPTRRDGLQLVFFAHFGPICFRMLRKDMIPTIHKINTGVRVDMHGMFMRNGQINFAKLSNVLSGNEARSTWICRKAISAVQGHSRKVLILTDRRAHVDFMVKWISENSRVSVRPYVGGTTTHQQEIAEKSSIIVATFQMFQEGTNIPALDTLFLAAPKSDITQSIGRILRQHPGKKDPLVVDMVDSMTVCERMWEKRMRIYKSLGYTVVLPKAVAPKTILRHSKTS